MSSTNRNGALPSPTLPPPTPAPRQFSNVNARNAISCLPYYHPQFSGIEQVKELLSRYMDIEGSFILRNSMSKPGFYTLSVTHSTGIKHLNVEITSSATPCYYLRESVKFETMGDLVNFYGRECVPNKEKIGNVRLLNPILRPGASMPVDHSPQQQQQQDIPQSPRRAPDNEYKIVIPDNDVYIDARECGPPSTPGPNAAVARNTVAISRRSDLPGSGYTQIPSEPPLRRDDIRRQMMLEETDVIKCDCGLVVEEAAMPRGWSVHLSQHPSSFEEVYFMSPEGVCQWTLPLPVSLELTATQQDLIRDLILNFERKTNRIARAKSASSPGGASFMGPPTISDEDSVHHRSWLAKVSKDSNYVAPSPPWQPTLSSPIVPTSSGRSTILMPPSFTAQFPADDDDDDTDDDESKNYMAMDGAHLKRV